MSEAATKTKTLEEDLNDLKGMLAKRQEKTGSEWRQANRGCEQFADQLISKWGLAHIRTIKDTLMGIK